MNVPLNVTLTWVLITQRQTVAFNDKVDSPFLATKKEICLGLSAGDGGIKGGQINKRFLCHCNTNSSLFIFML